MTPLRLLFCLLFSISFSGTVANAETLAKQLFGAKTTGSHQKATPYGSYAKGCVAGAVQLPETGATWQAMRLSRNRNWGHPQMIDFIGDLGKFAAKQPGWKGLYVGDISQPRGGPMLSGHRSHQIGLDADIWMLPTSRLNLSRQKRESISSISTRRAKGAYVNSNWSRAHHRILRAAAKDKRVARIFVIAGAKVQMCNDEKGNRKWLRKIRPLGNHDYHFHVRLKCPKRSRGCDTQVAPPPGDGCDEARLRVKNILNPP
ncbi:MAG: penicillin-insensitive murein endopeptidase, partial [Rhodobacteraceae bacterium]|nr:penicillin-insensitive murein endopeptidase [Paracoccaceae bacterium]